MQHNGSGAVEGVQVSGLSFVAAEQAPGSVTSALEYRPAIDGLRAVAVLGVFFFHLSHRLLSGGFVGVDIFFVISGYLITSIILKDCERDRFSLPRFYQRRVARLLAAFYTVSLFTFAGAAWIYTNRDLASAAASLAGAAGFVANLKFMFEGNYFIASPDAQPFLHCWSLSVEEQFYLIFPTLFVLLFRTVRKHRALVLTVLCLISLAGCIILTRSRPVWAFYLLPTRAWELLAGSIFATMKKNSGPPEGKMLPALPLMGLLLIGLTFLLLSEGPSFPGWMATLPVLGTVCFLIPYDLSGGIAERLLS
jgi:peptidoglycan/LPS O-acetylase OafA/YrhL